MKAYLFDEQLTTATPTRRMTSSRGLLSSVLAWVSTAICIVYLVIPTSVLILFREPEISSTISSAVDEGRILMWTAVALLLLYFIFVYRSDRSRRDIIMRSRWFVIFSITAIYLGRLKYRMDTSLWQPPQYPETNLTGKVAVVTGGNSGIGLATAQALTKLGAQVVITCRSTSKCDNAARKITMTHSADNDNKDRTTMMRGTLETEELDLSRLQSVYDLSARLIKKHPRIHYLFLNAGSTPYNLTKDGYEDGWGSMHLSHMALTLSVLPSLRRAGVEAMNVSQGEQLQQPARVIVTSSDAGNTLATLNMYFATPAFHPSLMEGEGEGDLRGEYTRGDGTILGSFSAYARAKLSNTLFSLELNRYFRRLGWPVIAHSLHTGAVGTRTSSDGLSGMFVAIPGLSLLVKQFLVPVLWRDPDEGARTLLYAALSTDPPSMVDGGQYINGICQPTLEPEEKAIAPVHRLFPSFRNMQLERARALRIADETWSKRLWDVSLWQLYLPSSPFRDLLLKNQDGTIYVTTLANSKSSE